MAGEFAISPMIPQLSLSPATILRCASFDTSFYPLHFYSCPVARSWWGPFPRRGVASPQAPDLDLESLPETISQSTRVGPDPRWLDGPPGASHSSSPFRDCTEALDTASVSQGLEQAKVPDALLTESPSAARPEKDRARYSFMRSLRWSNVIPGSKINALVLRWVEDSVDRSDSPDSGVAGSFS